MAKIASEISRDIVYRVFATVYLHSPESEKFPISKQHLKLREPYQTVFPASSPMFIRQASEGTLDAAIHHVVVERVYQKDGRKIRSSTCKSRQKAVTLQNRASVQLHRIHILRDFK